MTNIDYSKDYTCNWTKMPCITCNPGACEYRLKNEQETKIVAKSIDQCTIKDLENYCRQKEDCIGCMFFLDGADEHYKGCPILHLNGYIDSFKIKRLEIEGEQ